MAGKNPKPQRLVAPLLDWFAQNARDLPWRRTHDPYAIWVSEIMLQQTQVKTVIPYWNRWMRELPAIESLAKASPEKIHKLWEGLGYYTRVRNLQKAAQQIVGQHDGKFPEKFDDVLALPGIGRYTAGAICSIAFNEAAPILDGNVIRVLTRVFDIATDPREKKTNARLWRLAGELVADAARRKHNSACSHLNQSLMELGALICTPRQPKCVQCPVKKLCLAYRENRVGQLPNLGERAAVTELFFTAFIVRREGKFLVRQRPAGVVNAHLWEFPNFENVCGKPDLEAARNSFEIETSTIQRLCVIKHSITRYRITLEAFIAGSAHANQLRNADGRWLALSELKRLSFPSAHKKILDRLDAAH